MLSKLLAALAFATAFSSLNPAAACERNKNCDRPSEAELARLRPAPPPQGGERIVSGPIEDGNPAVAQQSRRTPAHRVEIREYICEDRTFIGRGPTHRAAQTAAETAQTQARLRASTTHTCVEKTELAQLRERADITEAELQRQEQLAVADIQALQNRLARALVLQQQLSKLGAIITTLTNSTGTPEQLRRQYSEESNRLTMLQTGFATSGFGALSAQAQDAAAQLLQPTPNPRAILTLRDDVLRKLAQLRQDVQAQLVMLLQPSP